MNKYLIEILKIQSSVILPGLGALMVPSQKSGKIVFNQHLKFNDGSLAKFIAEKENVDAQDAQNQVAKFVREIEAELGKGNSYDMFEFGKFYKTPDGSIDFIMDGSEEETVEKPKAPAKEKKTEAKPAVVAPVAETKNDTKSTKEDKKEKKTTAAAKKVEKKKAPAKPKTKTTKAAPPKADKTEDKKTSDKQSKNTFVPPVEGTDDISTELNVNKKKDDLVEKVKKATEAAKKEVKVVAPAVEKKVEKVIEKVDVPTKSETKKEEDKKDPKPKDEKQSKNTFIPASETTKPAEEVKDKEEDNNKAALIAAAAATTAAVGASALTSGDSKSTTSATTENKVVKETVKETTIIKETVVKEEKKKRSKLPWLILLLILIGLGVAGFFYKDEIMAFFDKDENTEITSNDSDDNGEDTNDTAENPDDRVDTNDMIPTDSLENEVMDDSLAALDGSEIVAEELPVEEVIEEETPVSISGSNNGNYHLIGNSFGEEANAQRYVSKMEAKGYPAKVLGRFDGLYMVSLKSYDSQEAANAGRSSVSADAGSAWVFKYPK